jgi:hypothetical protein
MSAPGVASDQTAIAAIIDNTPKSLGADLIVFSQAGIL